MLLPSNSYFDHIHFELLLKEAIVKENIGQTGFYYLDKKRALNAVKVAVQQLPGSLIHSSSDIIIRHIGENVNRKISEFTQSKQFIQWFGDWQNYPESASKVLNADGTPKIVYHRTNENFTVCL